MLHHFQKAFGRATSSTSSHQKREPFEMSGRPKRFANTSPFSTSIWKSGCTPGKHELWQIPYRKFWDPEWNQWHGSQEGNCEQVWPDTQERSRLCWHPDPQLHSCSRLGGSGRAGQQFASAGPSLKRECKLSLRQRLDQEMLIADWMKLIDGYVRCLHWGCSPMRWL